jgi:hypothetical protein
MNKEFIPYTEALELKELEFDEPCFGYYVDGELRGINLGIQELGGVEPYYQRFGFHTLSNNNIDNQKKIVVTAPTFSQAFRFFRENHNLDSFCRQQTTYGHSYWKISVLDTKLAVKGYSDFTSTYEEAEIECLKKLIEIVKQK